MAGYPTSVSEVAEDCETPESKKNAFGVGSPSWNLPFPVGNLTAAEIMTYLPHWLKSIDVVDRFVTNGGRSHTISAIVNEFRILPLDRVFSNNSAQVMMSYNMRRAGFVGWQVGIHHHYARPDPDMKESDLNVQDFRCPRETHLKSSSGNAPKKELKVNQEAKPIDFKDLARFIKKHPKGNDILDLGRCVAYALAHKDEIWLFPTDFELLVNVLGGPATITKEHLDRQIFDRRENKPARKRKGSNTMPKPTKNAARSTVPASPSPLKRMMSADDSDTEQVESRRKSGRLADKPTKGFLEYLEYGSDTPVSYYPL